jgi:hypothetical protein
MKQKHIGLIRYEHWRSHISDREVQQICSSVEKIAPNISWTDLAEKCMPDGLKKVLDNAIQIVNFIKSRPTNYRIFKELCKKTGTARNRPLSRAKLRWYACMSLKAF